jgi:chromosome partitioning protein
LPRAPAYCGATPTERVPFFGSAVSSITRIASGPPTSRSTIAAPALLLDADPQGSLVIWHNLRTDENPQLIHVKEDMSIPDIIAEARAAGFRYVIIDTPPHAENLIKTAIRESDIVVIPTRPGPLDLAAVKVTLDMANSVGKPSLTVINHSLPPTSQSKEPTITLEARDVLAGMGAVVTKTAVAQRAPLSHAIIGGVTVVEYEPKGKAAKEIKGLWQEILRGLEDKLEKAA